MRGALIVLEGLDRAGKSSQCEIVVDHLNATGFKAKLLRFPDRTTAIGQVLSAYLGSGQELSDQAVHLLFSANRWEVAASMVRDLEAGWTLVLDRYYFSGIAFTLAKNKRELSLEWCQTPDWGLPQPDLTLFLNLSREVQAARGGFGNERYEKHEFQDRVREAFETLRTQNVMDCVEIDADQSFADVSHQLTSCVDIISYDQLGPIKRFGQD